MSENMICSGCDDCYPSDKIKEAVCINASRIYDSCSDKDCLEDLNVLLTKPGQCMVDKAANVRLNDVEVCNVSIGLQPVPFHKGFYSVDMTFYFDVSLDVFMAPNALPMPVKGLAVFSKRAVLFGSEGSVKVFSSECGDMQDGLNSPTRSCPKAVVQVAEPIPRNVQMLIPAYDFCIPHKECVSSSEDPCELFSSIDFPTNEFFPSKLPTDQKYHCGCGKDEA